MLYPCTFHIMSADKLLSYFYTLKADKAQEKFQAGNPKRSRRYILEQNLHMTSINECRLVNYIDGAKTKFR